MSQRIRLVLSLVACVLFFAPVRAEEPSSVFNPFSKKKPAPAEQRGVSDDPDSSFSLPSLPKPPLPKPSLPKFRMPKWSMAAQDGPDKPSTWDKVSKGTKGFFVKTKQVLMPWAKSDKVARQETRPPGTPVYRSASRPGRDDEGKSLLPSWLQSKPEEDRVESVNDFLSLPSPRFN